MIVIYDSFILIVFFCDDFVICQVFFLEIVVEDFFLIININFDIEVYCYFLREEIYVYVIFFCYIYFDYFFFEQLKVFFYWL